MALLRPTWCSALDKPSFRMRWEALLLQAECQPTRRDPLSEPEQGKHKKRAPDSQALIGSMRSAMYCRSLCTHKSLSLLALACAYCTSRPSCAGACRAAAGSAAGAAERSPVPAVAAACRYGRRREPCVPHGDPHRRSARGEPSLPGYPLTFVQ